MSTGPLVSVVIPTAERPDLVQRALQSALAQTHGELEVVVVVDGPDADTRRVLAAVSDPRVLTVQLDSRVGPGPARNAGVEAASGRWIAFLDDDDEWFPDRVERGLTTAGESAGESSVIVGRVELAGGGRPGRVWPRRLPAPGEPVSEYLFSRRGLFWGEALVQTSTWLVERPLLLEIPFRAYRRHEDLDWLLRASRERSATVQFVDGPDPVSIWHVESGRPRASAADGWRDSMQWARENQELFTARAYASFLLVQVAADAFRQGDRGAVAPLLREAVAGGRPRLRDLMIVAGLWVRPR